MSEEMGRAPSPSGLAREADERDVLAALRVRLERATGPDREIEADLALLDGWTECPGDTWIGPFGEICVPNYTSSVDAALGLIERAAPEWTWQSASPRRGLAFEGVLCRFFSNRHDKGPHVVVAEYAPTPALALLRALLAALTIERPDERQATTEGRRANTESNHGGRG